MHVHPSTLFHGLAVAFMGACRFNGMQLPAALTALLQAPPEGQRGSEGRPCGAGPCSAACAWVCVDLGSMGPMGLIPRPSWTMRVLARALEQAGL